MSLASEYQRQFGWRDWRTAFELLPPLQEQTVLDLGCAVGDLAAEFTACGANVIGVDANDELLAAARSRLPQARFENADLRALPDLGTPVDGVWCSFTAAYFPDLPQVIPTWIQNLKPGGWLALVEIDDLFGHEPVSDSTRSLLEGYAAEALAAGHYDFRMGRRIRHHMQQAGLTVSKQVTLADREFSFDGPADPEIVEAWRDRFQRMLALRAYCGPDFDRVEKDFLNCLTRSDHRALAKVYCCIAAQSK